MTGSDFCSEVAGRSATLLRLLNLCLPTCLSHSQYPIGTVTDRRGGGCEAGPRAAFGGGEEEEAEWQDGRGRADGAAEGGGGAGAGGRSAGGSTRTRATTDG